MRQLAIRRPISSVVRAHSHRLTKLNRRCLRDGAGNLLAGVAKLAACYGREGDDARVAGFTGLGRVVRTPRVFAVSEVASAWAVRNAMSTECTFCFQALGSSGLSCKVRFVIASMLPHRPLRLKCRRAPLWEHSRSWPSGRPVAETLPGLPLDDSGGIQRERRKRIRGVPSLQDVPEGLCWSKRSCAQQRDFNHGFTQGGPLNQLKKCASEACSTLINPNQELCSRCEMRARGTGNSAPAKARSSYRPPKKRR
jgi:hypothetical protein